MHRIGLIVFLALCGCSNEPETAGSAVPKEQTLVIDHALPAFGGRLLGIDRGEWGGSLSFEDEAGNRIPILDENVHGIVENSAGVFAFTGLAHLRTNDGYIYIITREPDERVYATMLGRLPGAPSQVTPLGSGTTAFLVFAGFRGDAPYFECYTLVGRVVSRSNQCSPPKEVGANNSSMDSSLTST